MELCLMLVECCSQEKTYLKYYGFIACRICLLNRVYQVIFQWVFFSFFFLRPIYCFPRMLTPLGGVALSPFTFLAFQDAFEEVFKEQYSTIHRLETNKLRNVAKIFAHLLYSDSLPWTVFEVPLLFFTASLYPLPAYFSSVCYASILSCPYLRTVFFPSSVFPGKEDSLSLDTASSNRSEVKAIALLMFPYRPLQRNVSSSFPFLPSAST
jgi:hypothetical protein